MKLRLGELTSAEARTLFAARPVILLPLGSHEDQGPHAPMGDYLLAERMGELIAGEAVRLGVQALVAPVLPYGHADWFGSAPGGIALSSATFRAVLGDVLGALLRHGLDRIVLLNGHGGNVAAIQEVTLKLKRERGVTIPSLYLWRAARDFLPPGKPGSGHGGEPLTSLYLHLFPALVRPDLMTPPAPAGQVLGLPVADFGQARFEGSAIDLPMEYDAIAPSGVTVDPSGASAEQGRRMAEGLTTLGARFIRHFVEQTAGEQTG